MGWLISLIIAGAIIYYLVIGSRAGERDADTVGVDSGDVLVTPGNGDEELADEFTHFGGGAEFVADEEYAEESAIKEGMDRYRWRRDEEEGGEEEFAEGHGDLELDHEGDEEEFASELGVNDVDEEYAEEPALEDAVEDVDMDEYDGDGIEGDGMLMGKDTGLRVDEEAEEADYRVEENPESIANARSGEELVDEAILDNLNIVGDDFGMLMGINDEVDLDEVHPKRGVKMDRLSARLTGDEYGEHEENADEYDGQDYGLHHNYYDEEVGEELMNGDELGGVRPTETDTHVNSIDDHDDLDIDTVPTATNARMSIDVEDETYMDAKDVERETKSERRRERRRRRRNHKK